MRTNKTLMSSVLLTTDTAAPIRQQMAYVPSHVNGPLFKPAWPFLGHFCRSLRETNTAQRVSLHAGPSE